MFFLKDDAVLKSVYLDSKELIKNGQCQYKIFGIVLNQFNLIFHKRIRL
jgi:hypothetical protein